MLLNLTSFSCPSKSECRCKRLTPRTLCRLYRSTIGRRTLFTSEVPLLFLKLEDEVCRDTMLLKAAEL